MVLQSRPFGVQEPLRTRLGDLFEDLFSLFLATWGSRKSATDGDDGRPEDGFRRVAVETGRPVSQHLLDALMGMALIGRAAGRGKLMVKN